MKLLCTGDWHLKTTAPENRIDDFFFVQKNKVEQILKIAQENKCQYILQPGDFTDTPRPSFELIEEYVSLFKKYDIGNKIKILHVYGQHDMYFRSKERTATKLFNFLGYLQEVSGVYKLTEDIHLYGASWGDEIPIIEDSEKFNILLIHKTILDKKPFWAEDCLLSDKIFKKYEYDIVVCGDYHYPAFYQYKHQTILNAGCIIRKSISEAEIIPSGFLINIDENDLTYNLKKIELKYEPADKVFKPEALNRETKEENKKLQEFIESIKNNEIGNSLNFKKNLELVLKSASSEVKEIIFKSLEEIEEE